MSDERYTFTKAELVQLANYVRLETRFHDTVEEEDTEWYVAKFVEDVGLRPDPLAGDLKALRERLDSITNSVLQCDRGCDKCRTLARACRGILATGVADKDRRG